MGRPDTRPTITEGSSTAAAPVGGAVSPWVIDALLAVVVAMALALIMATTGGPGRQPDLVAYLFAIGFGALMLFRRRFPRLVLTISVLAVFAYYTLDYPPIGVAVPLVAALFSAAEAGRTVWAVVAAAVLFVVSMAFRVLDGNEAIGFLIGYESVTNLALFAAAIALGISLRLRRLGGIQQAEIIRLTEAQFAREAEARVQTERQHISRELHDTVGHTLSVVSVQAGVAAEAIGRDDRGAVAALDRIRTASSRSLNDLRSMVRLMQRSGEPEQRTRVHSLSAVPDLVELADGSGVAVRVEIDVDPVELSAPVDAAGFRIVQESITNVLRHAGASAARVRAAVTDGQLSITITDDGRGAGTGPGTPDGNGIPGMAERVRLLGGTLTAGPRPDGGFAVQAKIPARLP